MISVVVPVYNAALYLRECIESILSQSINNFELILVDDCSTDESLTIIKEYAARDERIKYTTLPCNSGAAKIPRDTAISMATSEWICCVDADDYVDNNFLDKLYGRASETQVDIVAPRMISFQKKGIWLSELPARDFNMSQILPSDEAVWLTINGWKIGFAGALIKRSLYTNISGPEDVVYMNSDEYVTRELILSAKQMAFCDVIYYYRLNKYSITHAVSVKVFDRLITNRMLYELLEKHFGKGEESLKEMEYQSFTDLIGCGIYYSRNKKSFTKDERKKSIKLLKDNYLRADKKILYAKYTLPKKMVLWNYFIFRLMIFAYTFIVSRR